jgi:hypothetical protein
MSSTKIVIIVLVLVGLLFIIFVARGALRKEPPPKGDQQTANKTKPPDWAKTIKGLFSSLKPGLTLKQKVYSSNTEETVQPDAKQAFRTATFHRLSGSAEITYKDKTPIESDSPLKKMDNPQRCKLPDFDKSDPDRCAVLAFKQGGTLTFVCAQNSACKVEVE